MTPTTQFAAAARGVLAAIAALENACARYLAQGAALGQATGSTGAGGTLGRQKLETQLKANIIRGLQSVKFDGHKQAKSHALINGVRLAGIPLEAA